LSIETFEPFARRYEATFRAADWEAWSSLFSDDADFITWGGIWWRSRAEILAGHQAVEPWIRAQTGNYRVRLLSARAVGAEAAFVHAGWEWSAFQAGEDAATEDRSGVVSMLLIHPERGWLIQASHNTRVG
jgi:uncharacterized protein (TIGR02246 family)